MIAFWPVGISESNRGGFVRQAAYLQDVMPTVIELSDGSYPTSEQIWPCLGKSIAPLFDDSSQPIHDEMLFWEHEGNAAVRDGKWKLVREYKKSWELYDITNDRTELNDLSQAEPERRERMILSWERWAKENEVAYPERFNMYEFLKRKTSKGN